MFTFVKVQKASKNGLWGDDIKQMFKSERMKDIYTTNLHDTTYDATHFPPTYL